VSIIREAMKNLPGHWYKGGKGDNQGNFCGIGHVVEIYDKKCGEDEVDLEFPKTIDLMNEVAREQYADRITFDSMLMHFAQFNDHPDTTEDEVLAVMEKAAIKLEEEVV
jgi:hypothetical protein